MRRVALGTCQASTALKLSKRFTTLIAAHPRNLLYIKALESPRLISMKQM